MFHRQLRPPSLILFLKQQFIIEVFEGLSLFYHLSNEFFEIMELLYNLDKAIESLPETSISSFILFISNF